MRLASLEIEIAANVARLQKDMAIAQRTVTQATEQMSKAAETAKTALASIGGGVGLRELIAISDQYTKFTAQIKLATQSQEEYNAAYADVRRIAKDAQQDLSATGTLYARISNGTRELGVNQARVAEITEVVNMGLKVSGATAQESASAQLQLSQAFASGKLRGEEFNAVNEAAPRLMKALADGMGVPIGALKDMATEGQITSKVMADVLPKALQDLRMEAAQIQTIGGAVTVLKNNFMEFIGTQAQASGAVKTLTAGINLLGESLSTIASLAIGYGAAKLAQNVIETTRAIYGKVAATAAEISAMQAQRAAAIQSATAEVTRLQSILSTTAAERAKVVSTLQASQATIAATASIGAYSTALAANAAATKAASAATAELVALGKLQTTTTAQLTAAQAAQTAALGATTAASTMASRALALVGGPIGLITTALGLGAAAWTLWGGKAKEANQVAKETAVESSASIIAELDKQIEKNKNLLAMRKEGLTLERAGARLDANKALGALSTQLATINRGLGAAGERLSNTEQFFQREQVMKRILDLTKKINEAETSDAAVKALTQAEARVKFLADYATKQEQLNAKIAEAKKLLGDSFTPADEQRIRDHFKVKNEGQEEFNRELAEQKRIYEQIKALDAQVANSQRGAHDALMQGLRDEESARNSAVVASSEALAAAQREYEQYGMSKSQIAEIVLLKLQEDAANKQAGSSAQISLQAQIENQKKIIEFLRSGELRDANQKAADDAAKEHARAYEQISQSLTDAIMRGGKNAGELLKDYFKTLILRPIIQAFVNPIAGAVTGSLGFAGVANAGTGAVQGVSLLSNISTLVSSLTNLPTTIANGVQAALYSTGLSSNILSNSMLATGAGMLSSGFAGYGISKGLSGGYSAGSWVNTAAGIASAIPGIGPIAGVVGALVNRAFGMKAKEFGPTTLNGSFGAGGFTGTQDTTWTQKGGWFRSDKSGVDKAPVDPAMVAAFTKGYDDLKKASTDFATVLGLNADSIQTRVQSMSIALSQNEAENEKAIAEFFAGVRDSMAMELLPAITALQQEGESAGDTLQRLAVNYVALDGILSAIGMSFGAVGESSLVARERLIAAAGGLDALAQNTAGFYQNFYTEAERLVPVQAQVTAEMARLGLAHVDTAEEFRDAVTGLQNGGKLATEEGANLFASLMKIQGAFALVHPLVDKAAEAAAKLAEAQRQQSAIQAEIDRLTMSENDLRARQFDLTNEQTKALWDQLMALEAANDAAAKAKEAADALKSVNDGWLAKIKEFDDSLLTETQRRANEIAAMDESTAALAKLYYARLDAKALDEQMAADELAAKQALLDRFAAHNGAMYQSAQVASEKIIRASEEALAAQQAMADLAVQKAQLEERAFMATATEAERLAYTRQKELAAIDPTLEALLRHAHAMEDQASAAVRSAQVLAEGRAIERDMAQLMGDTGKLRELELATIAVENHAAKKAYWAQQDKMAAEQAAAQAAAEMARAMAQAAEAQQRAAEQMKSAWQSVTDGIFDQVRKIRGSMAGNSATSLSQAQADFAVATARARAGDQEAAKSLSGLSDSLLDQALRNARSQQEYRAVQAAVAASLVATGRGFAGQFGLNTPVNAGSGAASEAALSNAIENLNREMASQRSVLNSINSNTRRNADLTEQVTNGGEAMIVAS